MTTTGAGGTAASRARWAWVLPAAAVVLEILGLLAAVTPYRSTVFWLPASFGTTIVAFVVVGGLISSRHPGNAVGWLLSTIGFMFSLVVACSAGARWGLHGHHGPAGVWEWWSIGAYAWVVALGLIGTQLALRLPDGRLPSERWRWFSRVTAVLLALSVVGMATTRERVEGVRGTANPIGSAVTEQLAIVFLLVILSFPVALASLVLRYRRSSGRDRAQLRWVALSGAVFVVVYVTSLTLLSFVDEDSTAATVFTLTAQVAFGAFPIGIGFAMLRRNLYDVDVVINRALVYGLLTATLAGTYVGGVLLLQVLLQRFTQGSGLAVAASTLACAALFRPARARIQGSVDRRFFRRKYDVARTLDRFGARLRDEVDLDAIVADLRTVATATMQPTHATLWLRGPGARS